MKLLIVKDESRMADLVRKGLTEEGHMVTCASAGAEGVRLPMAYIMMLKLSCAPQEVRTHIRTCSFHERR